MSARMFSCPVPGCRWSWRETARPVGHGPEFEQRLAQAARLRERVIAEHEQEHEQERERLTSVRFARHRPRHLAVVLASP